MKKPKSKRSKIPTQIATDILLRSNHICCICRTPGINPEIHHIDGNPSNNNPDNLIPLCPNCHSKVEQKGGRGRSYSDKELKKCRNDWFNKVNERLQTVKNTSNFSLALAQHDVKRIHYQIELAGINWDEIRSLLPKLIPYGRDFGYDVRSEIISVVATVSDRARRGIPKDVLHILETLLIGSTPIYSTITPSKRRLSNEDIKLILKAIEITRDLLWDICRYLRNVEVTEEAAYLFYYFLRIAHLNKLQKVKKKILEAFTECEKICGEVRNSQKFIKGKEILKKSKEDALSSV